MLKLSFDYMLEVLNRNQDPMDLTDVADFTDEQLRAIGPEVLVRVGTFVKKWKAVSSE